MYLIKNYLSVAAAPSGRIGEIAEIPVEILYVKVGCMGLRFQLLSRQQDLCTSRYSLIFHATPFFLQSHISRDEESLTDTTEINISGCISICCSVMVDAV